MKFHHVFIAGIVLFNNVNAAEPDNEFGTLGLLNLQSYAIVLTVSDAKIETRG